MASTPYQPVSWNTQEGIAKQKLNQMANNDQWLFENMPTITYNAEGLKRSTGVKILAGVAAIAPTTGPLAVGLVNFGSFFSSGCRPVIVATPSSPRNTKLHILTRGVDPTQRPDNRGFNIILVSNQSTVATDKILATCYVSYIAVGW